jgi:hypothetical protein
MPIVQINQTKTNDICLIVNLELVRLKLKGFLKRFLISIYRIFEQVIYALNVMTNDHALIGLMMSLGLGFGFGLTIFSQPDVSSASFIQFKPAASKTKPQIKADYLETDQFVVEIETNQAENELLQNNHAVTVPSFSGHLDDNQTATYFKGTVQLHNYLKTLELGDEIKLNQTNKLVKTFQIVEIKLLSRDQIKQLLPQNQPTIILYSSTGLVSDQYYCLIARN